MDFPINGEMVRKGYVIADSDALFVNAPVYTKEQYEMLKEIFADTAAEIADNAEALKDTVAKIIKNHIPVHLKKLFLRDDVGIVPYTNPNDPP